MSDLGCIGHPQDCSCKTCVDALYMTQREVAELTRRAFPERVLPLRFGPGWTSLDARRGHWAYEALAQLRKERTAHVRPGALRRMDSTTGLWAFASPGEPLYSTLLMLADVQQWDGKVWRTVEAYTREEPLDPRRGDEPIADNE